MKSRSTNTHRCATVLLVVFVGYWPLSAKSQISLGVKFEHMSYLQFESVPVQVTVRNDTDEALILGGLEKGSPLLGFEVKKHKEGKLKRITTGRIICNVVLMPAKPKAITLNLRAHFALQESGRYHVTVVVEMGNAKYVSKSVVVEIVPGIEVRTVHRTVPSYPDWRRTYSLRSWKRNRKEHLFLRVVDKEQSVSHGVFCLGSLLTLREPEITIGVSGLVMVRHQSGPMTILHTTFRSDREGVVFVHQRIETLGNPPTNVRGPD